MKTLLYYWYSFIISPFFFPSFPLFVSGRLALTFFTSHAFDWLLHQTWFLTSKANRACDINENQHSAKNLPPYRISSSTL